MRASKLRGVPSASIRPALWFCACNLLAAALAAQCPAPVTPVLTNQTVTSGTATYSDTNALSTNAVINGSANITLYAGRCIELQPGFHATAGTATTTFHAWVDTAPYGLSASPSSGAGMSRQFTWTASSPTGYGFLTDLFILFAGSVNGQNACYIHYSASSNLLFLADNSGSTWLGGLVPQTSGTIGNPQCSIDASQSSISGSGNQLTLNVMVTFQPYFAGPQNDYLIAYDNAGLTSQWQQVGTWTVGTVGPPTAANSTVMASPTEVVPDGSTTSIIMVTLKDANGNPVSGKTVTLAQGNGHSTVSAASGPLTSNGVVTFTVKDATAETVTYTATDTTDSVTISQTASVIFTTAAPTASNSTVIANPISVAANGSSTATITVTLKDAGGNPVSGKTVAISQGAGHSTISGASGPSNSGGIVTFTATDTTAENVTYTAQDTTDSLTLTQTAVVSFTATANAPSITSLTPATGNIGTPVTIAGVNFGSSQGTSSVTFNGTNAGTAASWSAGSITINVPSGATTGNVVVTVGGVQSNGVPFTVDTDPVPATPAREYLYLGGRVVAIGNPAPTGYSITGSISGGGLCTAGVLITLSGPVQTSTTTDSNGNYAFNNLPAGSYTITPTKSGCSFSPSYVPVTITNSNVVVGAFSGGQPPQAQGSWSAGGYAGYAVSKFTFAFYDALGPGNIQYVGVDFNPSGYPSGGCNAYFYANGYSYMVANGTYPSGYWGQNGVLHSSSCDIDLSGTRLYTVGSYLYLDLPVLLEPAFNGSQNIWLTVANNQGLLQTPTWLQVGFNFYMGSSYSFQVFWTNPVNVTSFQQSFTVAGGDYLGSSSIQGMSLSAGSNYNGSDPVWCWVYATINPYGYPTYWSLNSIPSSTGSPWYSAGGYAGGGTISTGYCSLNLNTAQLYVDSNYAFFQVNLTALSPLYGLTTYLFGGLSYSANGYSTSTGGYEGTWIIP
jgi:hypothetical protein